MKAFPNLLVIGAMKAGTTSFHDLLNQHPEIFMSEVKELNFFIKESIEVQDIANYKKNFNVDKKIKYTGESSVSYSKRHHYSGVPQRIRETIAGDIKIIYLLRNPINRFLSNFTDGKTYGDVSSNYSINYFVKSMKLSENPYVLTGAYFYQISPFIDIFSLRNILLLEYEELINDTQSVIRKVCEFLDIENKHLELPLLNNSSKKRLEKPLVSQFQKSAFYKSIGNLISSNTKKMLLESRLYNTFFKRSIQADENILNSASIELLTEYYKPEIDMLKKHTGFEPKYWKQFNSDY